MNIIHPFSNLTDNQITIDKAENYEIYSNGKKYLDFISGLYNCPLGYSSTKIKNRIFKTFDELPTSHTFSLFPGYTQTNKYSEFLAEKLKKLIPFGKHISFTNSGSEAIDLSLRYAQSNYPNKNKIISYNKSYHGSTMIANKISGNLNKNNLDNSYIDFYGFDNKLSKDKYLEYVEDYIIKLDPNKILCFVAEPMIGASGGYLMKENVLPEIFSLCKKYKIITILDEVISGFGRLGEMFAFEKYNVQPDILILSKQITNGYLPLGCCILSDNISLPEQISMGFTTSGNPVSCAAAIETIEILPERNSTANLLSNMIESLNNPIIFKIEITGCFAAFHFSKSQKTLVPFEYNIGGKLAEICFNKGLIVRGNPKSLILAPGYNLTYENFNFAKNILTTSLNELQI